MTHYCSNNIILKTLICIYKCSSLSFKETWLLKNWFFLSTTVSGKSLYFNEQCHILMPLCQLLINLWDECYRQSLALAFLFLLLPSPPWNTHLWNNSLAPGIKIKHFHLYYFSISPEEYCPQLAFSVQSTFTLYFSWWAALSQFQVWPWHLRFPMIETEVCFPCWN